MCRKCMKQLFNDIPTTSDFFFFLIFQNQSVPGNVIQRIKKEKPNGMIKNLNIFGIQPQAVDTDNNK